MFETLYRYSGVLVRHLNGPAAEERDRYVTYVAAAGAARGSLLHLASELLLVAQRLDIDGTRAITPEEITSAADRWVRHQRRHRRIRTARFSRQRFVQVATDWLRFLGRIEAAPELRGAGADLVDEFAAYMRLERGLSSHTVHNRCWHAQAFLTWLDEQHCSASAANLEHVDAFLAMRGGSRVVPGIDRGGGECTAIVLCPHGRNRSMQRRIGRWDRGAAPVQARSAAAGSTMGRRSTTGRQHRH